MKIGTTSGSGIAPAASYTFTPIPTNTDGFVYHTVPSYAELPVLAPSGSIGVTESPMALWFFQSGVWVLLIGNFTSLAEAEVTVADGSIAHVRTGDIEVAYVWLGSSYVRFTGSTQYFSGSWTQFDEPVGLDVGQEGDLGIYVEDSLSAPGDLAAWLIRGSDGLWKATRLLHTGDVTTLPVTNLTDGAIAVCGWMSTAITQLDQNVGLLSGARPTHRWDGTAWFALGGGKAVTSIEVDQMEEPAQEASDFYSSYPIIEVTETP